MRRNIQKIIDTTEIDFHYDLTTDQLRYLIGNYVGHDRNQLFDIVCNSFKYGYAMGVKAEQNRIKKGRC